MLIPKITSDMELPGARMLNAGMVRILQMVVVSVLALALVLAGRAHAMVPGHSTGMAAFVICSDEGMKTVYLDAGGAPERPRPDCWQCPDCNGAPALATPPMLVGPATLVVTAVSRAQPVRQVLPPSRHLRPETRGPPLAAHGIHDPASAAVPLHAESGAASRWIGRPLMEART